MFVEYGGKFYRLLHPRFTVIIGVKCGDRINLMPASWNTPISEEPPSIGVAVDKASYTHECLSKASRAVINVPTVADVDLIYALGSVSGRDVDKVAKFGVKLVDVGFEVPVMENAVAAYLVEKMAELDVGEVTFYVFRVLRTLVKKGAADEWGLALDRYSPALHGAGRVFHRVDPRKLFAKKR